MPVIESDPHQAQDSRRVADEPGVAIVARRPCLAGELAVESQRARASGRAVVEHVLENVIHHVADARGRDAFHLHFAAFEEFSFARRNRQNRNRLRFHAQVCEGGVGVGDFERRHLERAERHGRIRLEAALDSDRRRFFDHVADAVGTGGARCRAGVLVDARAPGWQPPDQHGRAAGARGQRAAVRGGVGDARCGLTGHGGRLSLLRLVGWLRDAAGRSTTVDEDHGAVDVDPARVDLDEATRRLEGELHAGLDHDLHAALEVVVLPDLLVAIPLDDHVSVLADELAGLVLHPQVQVLLGVDEHLLLALGVLEAELVEVGRPAPFAGAGLDAGLGGVRGQLVGRHLGGVVDAAGDDGLVGIAFQEVDDHLLADARQRDPSPVGAGPRVRDPDPAARVLVLLAAEPCKRSVDKATA